MNSIPDMVEVLRGSPRVVGLAEYGSASHTDEVIHGDYELIVVPDAGFPDIESLHFHVGETPVDLNVRTLEQIAGMDRANGFESILLEARVIYDPSGEVRKSLAGLRDRHHRSARPQMGQERIAGMRHGARHTFDKLRGGRDVPVTLTRYMLHQCVYWAVPQYFEIRGLPYKGEKHGLAYLKEHEPRLFQCIEEFYATTDPREQERIARAIEVAVLAPVGGLWEDGELLTFGDGVRGEEAFRLLFGEDRAPKQ